MRSKIRVELDGHELELIVQMIDKGMESYGDHNQRFKAQMLNMLRERLRREKKGFPSTMERKNFASLRKKRIMDACPSTGILKLYPCVG